MTPSDQGDHWLTRREWDAWRQDVFEYRQAEFQKQLAGVMATINRLDSVVTKFESVAQTAEKWRASWLAKAGLAVAMLSPIAGAVLGHLWK